MSLNWSTQKVQYFKDNPDELWRTYSKGTAEEYEDLNAETKSLVFGSMALGLSDITESNASEWYARWKMYEKYEDLYLYSFFNEETNKYDRVYLTPDIIVKHIGLSTNASIETTTAWSNRFAKPRYKTETDRPTSVQTKAMIIVFKMEFDEILSQTNKVKETV